MGPKKQQKKEPVQQPPKQEEPQIPEYQLQGYGKFQYLNGNIYEGKWRLFDGIKMKHGQGTIRFPNSSALASQSYQGNWVEDKMEGYGTYKYASGAVYKGEWLNNKHHGKGVYEFPNGTIYDGQWQNHLMHGTGTFIDINGRQWTGQYRNGKFETKKQKQLLYEREIENRKAEASKKVLSTVDTMLAALAKSDKKTFKQNFIPFFVSGQAVKQYVKQPYSKFDQRLQDKWTDFLNHVKLGKVRVLKSSNESNLLGEERVLARQLEGQGQIVELINQTEQRTTKIAFVQLEGNVWICVATADEQKKK